MTYSMSSRQRLLAAALVLSAALPAVAQQAQPAQQVPAAQDAQAAPVQSVDSMTVTRDADTGKLRASTAAEQAQLTAQKAKAQARFAAPRPLPKVHASGARGARLTDDFFTGNSLIAVRKPDGKIALEHGDPASVAQGQADVSSHTNAPVTE